MKLSSNCERSAEFFMENRRMFLDSCVLNELAVNPAVEKLIRGAGKHFSTYISAISLLEVGFGPTDKADIQQQMMALDWYTNDDIVKVSSSTVNTKDPLSRQQSGRVFLYVPEVHEWYGARHKLIAWMDKEGLGGTSARKQANDALIFMCAWNANSFLITDNIKDFSRFNRIMFEETGGHLPIFSIEDLYKSVDEMVTFPENIPNYPIF